MDFWFVSGSLFSVSVFLNFSLHYRASMGHHCSIKHNLTHTKTHPGPRNWIFMFKSMQNYPMRSSSVCINTFIPEPISHYEFSFSFDMVGHFFLCFLPRSLCLSICSISRCVIPVLLRAGTLWILYYMCFTFKCSPFVCVRGKNVSCK